MGLGKARETVNLAAAKMVDTTQATGRAILAIAVLAVTALLVALAALVTRRRAAAGG